MNDPLSIDDVFNDITSTLGPMPGEEIARIRNMICSDLAPIRYIGDSLWEEAEDGEGTD